MFCANCGKELPEGAAFCPGCGRSAIPEAAAPAAVVPTAEPIQSYLALAILSTLLCCMPLGIVSIVYAAQVSTKVSAGDVAGARAASRSARNWGIAAAITGGVGIVLGVLFQLLVILIAAAAAD